MNIRRASMQDLSEIVMMGHEMHAESVTPFPNIEMARVAQQIDLTIQHPDVAFAAIAEDGEPMGFINAAIGDYAFSSDRRAMCDMWFVRPHRRRSTAGVRLMKFFLDWAEHNNAAVCIAGVSTQVEQEKTEALLQKFGFAPLGSTFIRTF